jgi:hypothetical protein
VVIFCKIIFIEKSDDDESGGLNINQYIDTHFFSQKKVEEITKKVNSQRLEEIKLEREFIKKVVNHIELNYGKDGNNGSLYDLFKSQVFNINLVIYYLDKKEETGIFDTLINILYERFINESFFFLPQLWYIVM